MAEMSRSFQSAWLKTVLSGAVCGSLLKARKSGTAMRMGAPRLVPVRIQSCAEIWASERASMKNMNRMLFRTFFAMSELPLIVEPEFNRYFVVRRRGTKTIDALDRANRRLVQRGNAARLLGADIRGRAIGIDVEQNIDAMPDRIRTNLHRVPVVGDLAVYDLNIPSVAAAKISATLKTESAFDVRRRKRAVGSADRSAFAESHNVGRSSRWLRTVVRRRRWSFINPVLDDLVWNRDGSFIFNGRLGHSLRHAFVLGSYDIVRCGLRMRQRNAGAADQSGIHGAAGGPARAVSAPVALGGDAEITDDNNDDDGKRVKGNSSDEWAAPPFSLFEDFSAHHCYFVVISLFRNRWSPCLTPGPSGPVTRTF